MTNEERGLLCGAAHPTQEGVTCVRKPCLEYHRSEAGLVWTEGATPKPSGKANAEAVAGVLRRTKAKARGTDPQTSHRAAASVSGLSESQQMVLEALRREGPMHDEAIYAAVRSIPGNFISLSGCRTRRSELVDRGLVEDSGLRTLTQHSRETIIWKAV